MKRLLFLALLFTAGHAAAQDRLQRIDSIFTALYSQGKFNGNILIAEKGIPVYRKSFGLANEATKQKLDENSVFELASVSKQFTAMAIVILQERGRLSYDDKLSKYIPELGFYEGVTLRHLLNHTAGLPDYMELMGSNWDTKKIATNNDVIQVMAAKKPAALFPSGTKYEYSNTGYALLASVIEKASGMRYADFLQQNIFRPLKMENTFVYNRRLSPRQDLKNYAYGYVNDGSGKKLPDDIPEGDFVRWLDGIVGDGTVNSTTPDLLKWDRALYGNKLVAIKAIDQILTPPSLPNGNVSSYGFGWMVDNTKDFGKIATHSGGWPGYVTYIERDLDHDKTIIVLQNNDVERQPPFGTIRKLLYGMPVNVKHQEIALSEDKLKPFVGEYELAAGYNMQVTYDKGLKVQLPGQDKFPIFPESESRFFLKVVDAQIEFFRDSSGVVRRLVLYQNGREQNAPKIK